MTIVTFFHWYVGNLNPEVEKNPKGSYLRKTDFKFRTYLMMARNWRKSLNKECERGLGLTNNTINFSSPYPL